MCAGILEAVLEPVRVPGREESIVHPCGCGLGFIPHALRVTGCEIALALLALQDLLETAVMLSSSL